MYQNTGIVMEDFVEVSEEEAFLLQRVREHDISMFDYDPSSDSLREDLTEEDCYHVAADVAADLHMARKISDEVDGIERLLN